MCRNRRLEDVELAPLLLRDDERCVPGDSHPIRGAPCDGLAGHNGHSCAQLAEAQRVLALAYRAQTGLMGCGLHKTDAVACVQAGSLAPMSHAAAPCATSLCPCWVGGSE